MPTARANSPCQLDSSAASLSLRSQMLGRIADTTCRSNPLQHPLHLTSPPSAPLVSEKMLGTDADATCRSCPLQHPPHLTPRPFPPPPLPLQVLDMIANAMDSEQDGVINFAEFLSAVRFNKIQYR